MLLFFIFEFDCDKYKLRIYNINVSTYRYYPNTNDPLYILNYDNEGAEELILIISNPGKFVPSDIRYQICIEF